MATLSNNDIARAIYETGKAHQHGNHKLFAEKVVQFLARKRLLKRAREILSSLEKISNEKDGRLVAKVSSKNALSEKLKKELSTLLENRYKAKEVVLKEDLDNGLVGGIKIEVGDEVIDLTLKNKIKKLQEHLTKSV